MAKEAIGAITELTHTDGRKMTVNVEYNQLDPLLRATINKDGTYCVSQILTHCLPIVQSNYVIHVTKD